MKLKKVLGDLKSNMGRSAIVVLALMVGLLGVGSILISNFILRNDLNENFIRTRPPHAIVTSKDFSKLDLAAFESRPEIESAEFRDLALRRIEVYPNNWIPLWLFGVDNFKDSKLAKIYREKGSRVPGPGTMLVERDGLLVSNLKIGSPAKIRTGKKVVEVPITGISFDPAQAPATQDHMIYAYVDKKTYSDISGEAANKRLVFRLKNVKTTEDAKAAVKRILKNFESSGIKPERVNVPKLNEHPHQWQLDTLLLTIGGVGLLALIMAAVLVSQLIAAILAGQIRQIGILKAIGASRNAILRIYITMVLVFGAGAGIVAIPLAIKSGYAFSYFVAGMLNFKILTTSLPYWMYLLLIIASLLMPVLLSLPAIMRGVNISVRDALSDYGIRSNEKGGKAAAPKETPLPHALVLAYRNTMRRKNRLAVTVVSMALGVAIFSTGFNVQQSLKVLISDIEAGTKQDVQVVLKSEIPKEKALLPFQSIKNVKSIEAWSGGFGELQTKISSTDDEIGIVALPYNTDLLKLEITRGRWLASAGKAEVVMNQEALNLYGKPHMGEKITLSVKGKRLKVKLVGIAKEFNRAKIYIDKKRYDKFVNPNHLVNSLMFVAEDNSYDKVIALKRDVEKALAPTDLSVLNVMSQAERLKIIYDHLRIILFVLVLVALIVLVVSSLGMASATSINIMERTREIGILRAIGATPQRIYGLFIAEGMIVGITGIILGLLLSWPLGIAASSFFGDLMLGEGATLNFAFSYNGFWITLISTLIFGYLAGRVPAGKAIKVSIREALSYE